MKKVLIIISLALFSLSFVATSCSDDNPVDCTQLLANYTNTGLEYTEDPTNNDKCIAFKNAIEDYLDSDCKVLTAEARADLQAELEALPCY